MALFARVEGSGNYLTEVLPAVLVLGFGLATNVAPLTATALSAAPAEHSGIASAVNNDVARTRASSRWRCCPRSRASPATPTCIRPS